MASQKANWWSEDNPPPYGYRVLPVTDSFTVRGSVRRSVPGQQIRRSRIPSKFGDQEVRAIRQRLDKGDSYRTLVREYGCGIKTIYKIKHYKSPYDSLGIGS